MPEDIETIKIDNSKNNNLFDYFELQINNSNISGTLKKELIAEIEDIRKNHDKEIFNTTISEETQIKSLMDSILSDNEINNQFKIDRILQLLQNNITIEKLEQENLLIKNINIKGENNDILDIIENLLKGKNLDQDILNNLNKKISELRNKIYNEKIIWTKSEQDEMINLLDFIISQDSEKISNQDKIKIIINIIDHSIKKEISETKYRKEDWIKTPQEIYDNIKKSESGFKKYGKIEKYNLKGKSPYLIIIIESMHQTTYGRDNNSTDKIMFEKIKKVRSNVLAIQDILFQKGISKIFCLEGYNNKEYDQLLPYQIIQDNIKKIHAYEKINSANSKPDSTNIELEYFFSGIRFYLEYKYGEEVLTFGIDEFFTNSTAFLLGYFYNNELKGLKEQSQIDIQKKVDIFISDLSKFFGEYIEYGIKNEDIQQCIAQIKNVLSPKPKEGFNYYDYKSTIFRESTKYKLDLRNEKIANNIQKIYENTLTNAIVLDIGELHTKNQTLNDIKTTSIIDTLEGDPKTNQDNINYVVIKPKSL